MNNEIVERGRVQLLPAARVDVRVRAGTMDDLGFIDALQRKTTKQVGFMPTKQFEGKIAAGHVLVAEGGVGSCQLVVGSEDTGSARPTTNQQLPTRLGYLIGNDQYFKRDDVGVIYQINVVPEVRRSLVAAMLLKAQFERSAYGCRLYCCWCAQDIEANRFWEAMGFVPLAFRTGGKVGGRQSAVGREGASLQTADRRPQTGRIHIFWQKRIRQGDVTTPWWFPSQTTGGSIREDRIVLPIPPGVRWSDEMPQVLPGGQTLETETAGAVVKAEPRKRRAAGARKPAAVSPPAARTAVVLSGGMRFATPASAAPAPAPATAAVEKARPQRRAKQKNDPALVAAARELRDRWLDEVNAGRHLLTAAGKYEVGRVIGSEGGAERTVSLPKLLAA